MIFVLLSMRVRELHQRSGLNFFPHEQKHPSGLRFRETSPVLPKNFPLGFFKETVLEG
jgi:hypothetical protein